MNGLPFWRGSGRSGSGAALLWAVKSFVSETKTKPVKTTTKTELIAAAVYVPFLSFCLCPKVSKYLSVVRVTPPLCGNRLVIEKEKRTLMESSGNIRG